jgi:predicted transcriptional regulator of viral defense system
MATSRVPQVVALTRRKGLLRPRDLEELRIPRQYLRMALEQGLVEKVARGLYQVPGDRSSQYASLAEVCKRVPAGVICLISALEFHGLTTQIAHFVYLAIPEKAHAPHFEAREVRIFRFSSKALAEGVEKHDIDGVEVRVYSAAKTVADCFKYRNRTGLDLAIEALRDCLRERKATVEELVRYGRICRVERVMRPYMEAMLG